ncbi:potassium-transporting ATPase subunit C [Anaerobiospirillum thomasii]|uniref:Potassium-transporting ATPase subunit C n=1 Tax=Anaerobiospirillum thomasii TaxID=179995 RepID=A0A2X0VAW0_9GAMM|nr:potassium-transporting ATPase subunit C [Anaerobiospirillum thomasii]SPT70256.1 potassium-transporting ATPase subunit C [Anaerobiospirillum thomasii]
MSYAFNKNKDTRLNLKQALFSTVICYGALTVILGLAYPVATSYLSDTFFYDKAHGSLIYDDKGEVRGSSLIGQSFKAQNGFFISRPSASDYNGMASGGYNLASTSQQLSKLIQNRALDIKEKYAVTGNIPTDMLTASASGLDYHISYKSALLQAPYVAKVRNIAVKRIYDLIEKHTEQQFLSPAGIVNVTTLNMALYSLSSSDMKSVK